MTIVLALGMSSPDSMIVVHTRTSCSPRGEGEHHPLERAFGHLSVRHRDARLRQQLAQLVGLGLDRLDAVVDEERLPSPIELAQDRVAHQPGRRLGDARLDRQPILGRRLDDAHVAHAGECQVQRPRDRRGRQRQHVDLGPHLLEPLLVGHAEALLLVDHDEPQVAELDVLGQQPVRADDQVDRPGGEPGEDLPLMLGVHEARQHPDA